MSIPRDDVVEDYLDHVCAPLVGIVPFARRRRLRAELREHLEMVLEDEGDLVRAIRELGEPWEAGTRFLREWEAEGPNGDALARRPLAYALLTFSPSVCSIVLATEVVAGLPQASTLARLPWVLESLIPSCAVVYGIKRPSEAARGTLAALALLGAYALGTALVESRTLPFAARLLLLWCPTGAGLAALSGHVSRHRRRSRFLRQASPSVSPSPLPPAAGALRGEIQ